MKLGAYIESLHELNPILFEYCLTSLNNPAASVFSAPNFFDKSISACSFETATLTKALDL